MKAVDKKGLFWFLLLTFGFTYLVEFAMMAGGISFIGIPDMAGQLIVAGVMFFPGIAAFMVRKFITKEGFADSGMKIGKKKYYLQTLLLIPFIFILIYSLSAALFEMPDLTLRTFLNSYGLDSFPYPLIYLISGVIISSLTLAPFINSIPAFGEEYGWRGYLLPKLLPLGTKKALVISGAIWGLWHAPLILMGFKYGESGYFGIIFFTILLVFIGIYIGYMRLISGSVILVAFIHGTINAQAYGVWTLIFPTMDPILGGLSGVTGIFVFLILSLWIFKNLKNIKIDNKPTSGL